MSTRIAQAFERARQEKRAAFVPYITAGDPSLEATRGHVLALSRAGADIIELGVPFSDPVADGPTNQAAAMRALARGTTLAQILDLVAKLRGEGLETALVLFTYLNPLYRIGLEKFAAQAAAAGVDGVLVVDLPPEEAEREYLPLMARHDLKTVFLASPTTAEDRLPLIDRASTGFVYYASRTGITGVQSNLTSTLGAELERTRRHVKMPMAVGFGISTPEHVRELAPQVDAVVVGSALVKLIEEGRDPAALVSKLVKELKKC